MDQMRDFVRAILLPDKIVRSILMKVHFARFRTQCPITCKHSLDRLDARVSDLDPSLQSFSSINR